MTNVKLGFLAEFSFDRVGLVGVYIFMGAHRGLQSGFAEQH